MSEYKKVIKDKKLTAVLTPEQFEKLTIEAVKAGFDSVEDYFQSQVISLICEVKIGKATIQRPSGSGKVIAPSNNNFIRYD